MSDEPKKEGHMLSVEEAVLALSKTVAKELNRAGEGISLTAANGPDGGVYMIVGAGKDSYEKVKAKAEEILSVAKADPTVVTENKPGDVDQALAEMSPKEDARGCKRHQKFAECVADYKAMIRGCWEPVLEALKKAGVDFDDVKDMKEVRHVIRTAVSGGIHVGKRMNEAGCVGYKGSKYKP